MRLRYDGRGSFSVGGCKVHIGPNCIAGHVSYRDICITPTLANLEDLPKRVEGLNTRTTISYTRRSIHPRPQQKKKSTLTAFRRSKKLYPHHPSHTFDAGGSYLVGDRKLLLLCGRHSGNRHASDSMDLRRLFVCPSSVLSSNFVSVRDRGCGDGNRSASNRALSRAVALEIEGHGWVVQRGPESPLA